MPGPDEPGGRFSDLGTAILRDDLTVAVPASSRAEPGRIRPARLPAALSLFCGRTRELAQLEGMLLDRPEAATAVTTVAICGTAGVGKTSLAVHWAHTGLTAEPTMTGIHVCADRPDLTGHGHGVRAARTDDTMIDLSCADEPTASVAARRAGLRCGRAGAILGVRFPVGTSVARRDFLLALPLGLNLADAD